MTTKFTINPVFQSFVNSIPIKHIQNPFWETNQLGYIVNKQTNKPFDILLYQEIINTTRIYFQQVYKSFGTEAQVLVITPTDYKKISHLKLPVIQNTSGYIIIVLPQDNTPTLTSVSEEFWQFEIENRKIIPFMRIHSHHIMNAYQSETDWSSLNSGTLEVVIGHIFDDNYHLAYWLDERGKTTKDTHFQLKGIKNYPQIIEPHIHTKK